MWRAISCCRLNRSPQVSHLNGSFARSATVILLLTVPHCGIRLLCRFKSCGRLNCFPHRSQDICKASLSTAVILRLFVICSIVVVIISSASRIHTYIIIIMRQDHQLPAQLGLHVVVSSSMNKWQCHKYPTLQQRFQTRSMMTDHLKWSASSQSILGSSYDPPSTYIQTCIAHT